MEPLFWWNISYLVCYNCLSTVRASASVAAAAAATAAVAEFTAAIAIAAAGGVDSAILINEYDVTLALRSPSVM